MDLFGAFDISAAGMNVERLRLDVASVNLANAQTTASPNGAVYKPLQVFARTPLGVPFDMTLEGFYRMQLGELTPVAQVQQVDASPRLVYEPGHPDANEQGFVAYPNINPVSEMVNLIAITRAYEANVRAMEAARTMALRALDIGGNR